MGSSTRWEQTTDQRFRHDLRQSVGLVMALAAGVQQNVGQVTDVLGRLRLMRHETERMAELVSAGATPAGEPQRVDVAEVVIDTWRSMAATAPCRMRLVCDAAAFVCVDPVTLARSVRNLLDNAVRAAGRGGAVAIQVHSQGDTVSVTVSDSGPGFGNIPSQQGLGLLTVRRFAEQHGGSLAVLGAPRGGARLRLRLPAAARESEE